MDQKTQNKTRGNEDPVSAYTNLFTNKCQKNDKHVGSKIMKKKKTIYTMWDSEL